MPKIVRFDKVGDESVLKVTDEPMQQPGQGEVRFRVKAIGLNRAEVLFRQGLYLEKPSFPARIGYEASGIVDAVGPGVSGFKIDDRVSTIPSFSMSQYGVYGEQAVVPAASLAKFPENLNFEEGAAIWMQYMTAYGALVEYGKMKAGDCVLITAASSSVGYAAIELCKSFGAISIATTRSINKKQRLLDAGADHVIVTDDEDLSMRVNAITDKHGADILFDAVAGPMLTQLAKAAAYGATIYVYGALSLENTPFPFSISLQKALTIRGYTLFHINKNADMQQRAKNYIYEALKSGGLKPKIDRVFEFSELEDAQKYMESNQQNGKIVLRVS